MRLVVGNKLCPSLVAWGCFAVFLFSSLALLSKSVDCSASTSNTFPGPSLIPVKRRKTFGRITTDKNIMPSRDQLRRRRASFPRGGAGGDETTKMDVPSGNNLSETDPLTATATESPKPSLRETLLKVRKTLFPIYNDHEAKKFFLIGSIKFFVIMALTLTRDTKDTLVVTSCGAEAIAFLKIYGVLPAATAFIAVYSKLSNVLEKKTLFYTACIPFFIFFALFDAFLYPIANQIQPSLATVEKWFGLVSAEGSGGGRAVVAKILANWTSALFYVCAEIYSSVSVGILFWQFANDVVSVDQAKRFYPLFAQMSGLAPIVAGQYVVRYASQAADFSGSMHRLTLLISFSGLMICVFYKLATDYVERTEGISLTNTAVKTDDEGKAGGKKKKPKMSMAESAKFLANSRYLRLVAALVLGYGLSINFTEIVWKSLVKKQYPDPLDYQRFIGNFSSAVGLSTCIVIFLGVHVIRILGWRVGALATPTLMAALAAPFFTCVLIGVDNPKRLQVAVAFGTLQSLLSKTAKYALFDPTTQMAYIPLDEESKVKGKAAIDVLGSRIGKSGGSLLQQGLVFAMGNIIAAAPALAVLYYAVLATWWSAANQLSFLFNAQTEINKAQQMEKNNDGNGDNNDGSQQKQVQ